MPFLVYVEQRDGRIPKPCWQALSEGRRMADARGESLVACIMGNRVSDLAQAIFEYGVDDLFLHEHESLARYETEPHAALLSDIQKKTGAAIVLMGQTSMTRDLAPRVAERLGAGLVTDCTGMSWDDQGLLYLRPLYAGKVTARLRMHTPIQMVLLRPNIFPPGKKAGAGRVHRVVAEPPPARAKVVDIVWQQRDRPELTDAEIIVSGGRGLGKAEGFQLIEEMADLLGAAVGASRAAVDAGWQGQPQQVGQTGKVVTPNLYVACGISGAVQHMAGMGTSRCIMAVNKDPEANIMKVADLSIEGDLYQVLPALIRGIEEKNSSGHDRSL
jgi:electron transfer flavoprotein alpha subunit